jgi:type I restriction enzyme S subunit
MTENCPDGWEFVRLGQVTSKVGSGSTPRGGSESYQRTGIPLIRSMNVRFEGFTKEGLAFLNQKQADALKEATVCSEDVLLNITGASIGRVTQAPAFMGGARVNQHVCIIRPFREIDAAYLSRYLASPSMQRMIWGEQYGATRQALTKSQILDFQIPLAPSNEQRRIVERIDALFEQVDSARDHLAKIPAILKRFREAVLAAACSGKLTGDWRERQGKLAEGSALLESILQERQRLWQSQQLKALRMKGQIPSDDKWLLRYDPPHPVVDDELPELPAAWTWASVEALSTKVVDGVHKTPTYVEEGIPFVTVKNLTAGNGISFDHLRYITKEDHAKFIERANPENGDILVSKDGTLGVIRAIRTDRPFSIFVSVALIKLVNKQMTDYMELALSSSQVQRQMGGTGSGLQHIHLRDLRSDCVPLPSLEEQQEVVCRVRALFALADAIEQRVAIATKRSEQLTQSILGKAFRGELVPTEAELARREGREYEPVSALLERIKKERVSETKPSRMERGLRKPVPTFDVCGAR